MTKATKTLRICAYGHSYYKSSDCPTCPKCEAERHIDSDFLHLLGAPARRALEHEGITTLQRLSEFTEAEILNLHGVGPSSMPKLRSALEAQQLSFKS